MSSDTGLGDGVPTIPILANTNPCDRFPPEICRLIFNYSTARDWLCYRRVSKSWYNYLADDHSLWASSLDFSLDTGINEETIERALDYAFHIFKYEPFSSYQRPFHPTTIKYASFNDFKIRNGKGLEVLSLFSKYRFNQTLKIRQLSIKFSDDFDDSDDSDFSDDSDSFDFSDDSNDSDDSNAFRDPYSNHPGSIPNSLRIEATDIDVMNPLYKLIPVTALTLRMRHPYSVALDTLLYTQVGSLKQLNLDVGSFPELGSLYITPSVFYPRLKSLSLTADVFYPYVFNIIYNCRNLVHLNLYSKEPQEHAVIMNKILKNVSPALKTLTFKGFNLYFDTRSNVCWPKGLTALRLPSIPWNSSTPLSGSLVGLKKLTIDGYEPSMLNIFDKFNCGKSLEELSVNRIRQSTLPDPIEYKHIRKLSLRSGSLSRNSLIQLSELKELEEINFVAIHCITSELFECLTKLARKKLKRFNRSDFDMHRFNQFTEHQTQQLTDLGVEVTFRVKKR